MAERTTAGATNGRAATTDREDLLSVVVITRNERDRVRACLESIFEACDPLERFEVVLVDSRSTDGTVDVAREFPVTILRLPEEPVLTPSTGRYVGTQETDGDLVLFVDGDMAIEEGWLPAACRRVRENPTLGGIDGHLNDSTTDSDRPVNALRGVALYDRSALRAAGGFDPFLQSNEDIDLSYRIADEGYRLVRLSTVVATHPPRDVASERWRRWQSGYYHGRGELIRKYLARPVLLARLLYRTWLYVLFFAWLSVGALGTVAGRRHGLRAWALLSALSAAGGTLYEDASWTRDKIANSGPVFLGVALGLWGRHPSPEEYPLEAVETLQTAPSRREPAPVPTA